MRKAVLGIAFGLICLLVWQRAGAQRLQPHDFTQLRLAQQYEALGQFEQALTIYRDLYRKNPRNFTYFTGLSNCLLMLKRYDELQSLIEERLRFDPDNFQVRALLGDVYIRQGKIRQAEHLWEEIIRRHRKNPSVYRSIANVLLQNRLYDEAIRIYLRGRKEIGRKDLYALELAQLHAYRQNYRSATQEYLRFLLANPHQWSYVESRLAQFSGTHETYLQVTGVLRDWIRKYPTNTGIRKLLISTLISFGDFEGAFREVLSFEKLRSAQKSRKEMPPGRELQRFGEICLREGRYDLARKAFQEILRSYPNYPDRGRVEFELARVESEQGNFREALRLYARVASRYRGSDLAFQAMFRRGEIFRDQLRLPDSAVVCYRGILERSKQNSRKVQALIALGEVEMLRGNLPAARDFFQKALRLPVRNSRQDFQRRVETHLRLAEVSFYEKDFEAVRRHVDAILKIPSGNMDNEYVNDALEFSLLVNNYGGPDGEALERYATALLYLRQHRLKEARDVLERIQAEFSESPILPRVLFTLADIQVQLGDYAAAAVRYQELVQRFPDDPLGDDALWRMARLYEEKLKSPGKAVEAYDQLLVRYPDSMYADRARRRIRKLEGKP